MGGCVTDSFTSSLRGAQCIVFGAGVTGAPTISFLRKSGAEVYAVDEKLSADGVLNSLDSINLSKISFAVVSPGWRIDNPLITAVREAGIELMSEIDLAWRVKQVFAPDQRWLALTGTNGKTTAVQMAEAMMVESGIQAIACGNVGFTAIEAVTNSKAQVLMLELSSFQLEWSKEAEFESVAILNIAEDHIDWHQNFDNDAEIVNRAKNLPHQVIWFSLNTPAPHQIGLVENLVVDRAFISDEAEALFELSDVMPAVPHNVLNAMAAAGLARSIGAQADAIATALRNFKLDHHRLEVVAQRDGITWIDDSKATNPHAAIAALQSQLNSIWIAGGLAKGAAMDELIQRCKDRIKVAILVGQDAPIIEAALRKYAPEIQIASIDPGLKGFEVMQRAVALAHMQAKSGDTVLLAPACASMDQFKNYAERGDLFAKAVKEKLNE
ncbi:MAG: UDP-N-acetylmuramoyl-L-alanine--D-glutamate ligase [Actinobacteria bacterium]|nr:UDP-N-acetylmuramoyl-L-alanine--D-glutamate ligase [Actinomycetota bacterium]